LSAEPITFRAIKWRVSLRSPPYNSRRVCRPHLLRDLAALLALDHDDVAKVLVDFC
jgi:hypothetical protein